jgi:hypothetical protein
LIGEAEAALTLLEADATRPKAKVITCAGSLTGRVLRCGN